MIPKVQIGTGNPYVGLATTDISKLKMPEQKPLGTLPTTPTTPPPPIETTLKTSDLAKTATPTVIDNSGVIKNIQNTLTKYTAEAGANADFVKGAIKASGQVETPELLAQYTGKKLGDVISGLGLGEKVGYTATPALPVMPASDKEKIKVSQDITDVNGNKIKATSKTAEQPQPQSATDKLNALIAENKKQNEENLASQEVVAEYSSEAQEANANIKALDEQYSAMGAQNSLEALGLKSDFLDFQKNFSKGQGLTQTAASMIEGNKSQAVNFDLSELSIEDGKNLANYTLARIPLVQNYNIAKGNYDSAVEYSKNVADAYDKSAKFQLDILEMQNLISQQDKDAFQKQIDNEIGYMKEGLVQLDPIQLEKVKNDIISGKSEGNIWQDPITGKSYWKPKEADETEKALVADMIGEYEDAGITLEDTLAEAQTKIKGSNIYKNKVRLLGGSGGGAGGGGTSGDLGIDGWITLLSSGNATIANVPQNIRNTVVKEIANRGSSVNQRMSDTEITKITDYQAGLSALDSLTKTANDNMQYVGPITGWQALNPWSKAKQVQSDIDRVKQTVGKALEGGVLRKEDEEKYKKILATITDTPETAIYKLNSLKSALENDLANYITTVGQAGRYTGGVKQPSVMDTDALRNKYKY